MATFLFGNNTLDNDGGYALAADNAAYDSDEYTATASGTLTSVYWYLGYWDGGNLKALVYDCDDSDALIATSAAKAMPGGTGWVEFTFASGPSITSGTTYQLALIGESGFVCLMRYSTDSPGDVHLDDSGDYDSPPDPLGAGDQGVNYKFMCYAEGTAGSSSSSSSQSSASSSSASSSSLSSSSLSSSSESSESSSSESSSSLSSSSLSSESSSSSSSSTIPGTVCWGHHTGVTEDYDENFTGNWTGTGAIGGAAGNDNETITLGHLDEMQSEDWYLGAGDGAMIDLEKYQAMVGPNPTVQYKTSNTKAGLAGAAWNNYVGSFHSDGWVKIKINR